MVQNGRSGLREWARTHIDLTLKLTWALALLTFGLSVTLLHPPLLGVLVGFALARASLWVGEILSESAFLDAIRADLFERALGTPGITDRRLAQILRRVVSDPTARELAERCAAFTRYALEAGKEDLTTVARSFEDTWGLPPSRGADSSLIRRLLDRGFCFTLREPPRVEAPPDFVEGIPWRNLWREWLWGRLRHEHPNERPLRLVLRLYASEWQATLAPIWVLLATGTLIVLSQDWLSVETRGGVFYGMFVFLGLTAAWLAFVLRPSAFNASLLAGDMNRCARWVLESTEGRHFLVAALGSSRDLLRQKAVQLLLWNNALLEANITLPEGMLAYIHREGTRRERRRRGENRGDRDAGAQHGS